MALGKLWVLAYRDLGRNRRRTLFSLVAVALGLALVVTLNGFITGVWGDALETTIRLYTGHVQLRSDTYEADKLSLKWDDLLANSAALAANAEQMPEVETATPILLAPVILSTAQDSMGLALRGIEPSSSFYDPIRDGIVAGEFLTADDRSGIVIGKSLADELGLQVGSNVSLSIVNASGQPDEAIFTVRGLFTTDVISYDEGSVFMPLTRAQAFADTGDRASAVIILLHDEQTADRVAAALEQPGVTAVTSDEMNRLIIETFKTGSSFYVILYGIVMLVVAVVIANTLLMSVFERIREMGILASLGMKGRQIMTMILIEAGILAVLGIGVGIVLGAAFVGYLANVGFAFQGMGAVEGFAITSTMYAQFNPSGMISLSVWTLVIILLASLYPAWFAARLEPVEALHSL
ncbi:MAG: ABC transporter permease [Caldilineaceae bacterium]|jgi:ABC-type lipoprotein release transport system permease subunit